MKKCTLLLCCILLLQMFAGCASDRENASQPTEFYYCNTEISYNNPAAVIQSEDREAAFYMGSLDQMLKDYLAGPRSDGLYSPIPAGTKLVDCYVEDGAAYITFSEAFASLSGVKLTVCCSCILMSINSFAGIQSLYVSAENAQIDEKKEFIVDMNDIILMDLA